MPRKESLPSWAPLCHEESQKLGSYGSPLLALHLNAVKIFQGLKTYCFSHGNIFNHHGIIIIHLTFLKNFFTASRRSVDIASPLAGLCSILFPLKLILAIKPVPKRDFNLIEVPMQRRLPFAMIPIRSLRMSASSIECVVRTMARPLFAFSIMSHTCLLIIGSIPVV